LYDVLDATRHFLRGAARKREQENAFGTDAFNNEVGNAMCERHGFAGPRTRYHKQWSRGEAAFFMLLAIFGGKPLRRVEKTQMIEFLPGNLHDTHPCKSLYFYTVLDVFTSIL
jgi:hypothetical protein